MSTPNNNNPDRSMLWMGAAIQMGQMDASRLTRPELRELAGSIVKTQTTEIGQMQKWYQTWSKSNP